MKRRSGKWRVSTSRSIAACSRDEPTKVTARASSDDCARHTDHKPLLFDTDGTKPLARHASSQPAANSSASATPTKKRRGRASLGGEGVSAMNRESLTRTLPEGQAN